MALNTTNPVEINVSINNNNNNTSDILVNDTLNSIKNLNDTNLHIELPKLDRFNDKNSKILTIITNSPKEKKIIKLPPLSPTIKPKTPVIINKNIKSKTSDEKEIKDKDIDFKNNDSIINEHSLLVKRELHNNERVDLHDMGVHSQVVSSISAQDLHSSELNSFDLNNNPNASAIKQSTRIVRRDRSPVVARERSTSPQYYRDVSAEKRRLITGSSPQYSRSFSPYSLRKDSSPAKHFERTASLSAIEEKNENQVVIEIMPIKPLQTSSSINSTLSALPSLATSPLNLGFEKYNRHLSLTTPRRLSLTTPYINRPNSPTLPTSAIYNEMLRHKPTYSHFNANYNFINNAPVEYDLVDEEFDAIVINKYEAIEPEASVVEMIAFITKLTHLLHKNGETMHRLQNIILAISKLIGLDCSIASTSNLVILTFGDRLTSSSLYHRKINLYTEDQLVDLNMYHLNYLQHIIHGILESKFTFRQACSLLYSVDYLPKIYNEYAVLASLSISSGCICVVFFNGSYQDFLFSCALGLLVGLFAYAAERISNLGRLQNILSAFLTSFISAAVSYTNPNFCLSANTLSGYYLVSLLQLLL